jgi:hypothetical protein
VRLDGRELAAIFAGGFVGAVARAELVEALPSEDGRWPWATFLVNVAGAFVLGYVTTRLQERLPLSAFSTMQVEILQMPTRDARDARGSRSPTRSSAWRRASQRWRSRRTSCAERG